MNTKLKGVIIFIMGAAVGGSSAAFIVYKWSEKKWMKISDERVKSLEEHIDNLEDRINCTLAHNYISEDESNEDNNSVDTKFTTSNSANTMHKGTEDIRYQNNATYTRYSQISKGAVDQKFDEIAAELEHPKDSDEDEDPDYIDEEEEERKRQIELSRQWTDEVNNSVGPMIISLDEYGATGYLDEVTLYYYTEDDTLTTEDDEIIPDRERVIGNAIDLTGFGTNDEKVIYVRNTRLSTDYEISKVFGAFYEDH